MSHPYTKSQLSEKLRRQRKKFRVISSRLARGLDPSSLSLHDRALFDISRRLWGPEFASTSPFGSNSPGFSHDHEINGVAGNGLHDADMKDNVNEPSLCYDFAAGRDEDESYSEAVGRHALWATKKPSYACMWELYMGHARRCRSPWSSGDMVGRHARMATKLLGDSCLATKL
ncbi:hypothetical protein F3Y22_tig00116962pilonHSYRG00147 [Hibiscus syriacus]|uniref:Glabrous enhancer-binding protein-like DBD domain-containing protein n=1 Tax=Hibiscus syriacus TaxID=106335 RepID=A0A6A2XXX6_HIBSY|nr:hypothetical protein F3Y22_tig00116962pilonHSYRG00147 [Hibiscus syriacus]